MNATISNAKMKCAEIAGKVMSSKAYKAVERTAVTAGATIATVGAMAINSSALGTVDGTVVVTTAEPYIEAGIPILLVVSGLRLGWRFLRGSTH